MHIQVVFFKFDAEFVNSVDSDGNTALHIASRYGHLVINTYTHCMYIGLEYSSIFTGTQR